MEHLLCSDAHHGSVTQKTLMAKSCRCEHGSLMNIHTQVTVLHAASWHQDGGTCSIFALMLAAQPQAILPAHCGSLQPARASRQWTARIVCRSIENTACTE